MAEKKKATGKKKTKTLAGKTADGKKVYGPFKGSKKNGGRPMMSVVNKDGSRTSISAARYKYEKTHGKLPKNVYVDHKNNNHSDDKSGNLRALAHGKNTAKENKRRVGKKENDK
jgi:hypothetical protein